MTSKSLAQAHQAIAIDVHVLKTKSGFFGVGYQVVLNGEVRMTCYGRRAKKNANKEAAKVKARLEHRPDPE